MTKGLVLVVEDDIHLLSGIQEIIELGEYEMRAAQNGVQGLEKLERLAYEGVTPDLIVSDIMMPHMDGFEFLAKVRESDEWVNVPFIFLTAKGEQADVQKGKILGADAYLKKPFDAEELLVHIDDQLNRFDNLKTLMGHMKAQAQDLKRQSSYWVNALQKNKFKFLQEHIGRILVFDKFLYDHFNSAEFDVVYSSPNNFKKHLNEDIDFIILPSLGIARLLLDDLRKHVLTHDTQVLMPNSHRVSLKNWNYLVVRNVLLSFAHSSDIVAGLMQSVNRYHFALSEHRFIDIVTTNTSLAKMLEDISQRYDSNLRATHTLDSVIDYYSQNALPDLLVIDTDIDPPDSRALLENLRLEKFNVPILLLTRELTYEIRTSSSLLGITTVVDLADPRCAVAIESFIDYYSKLPPQPLDLPAIWQSIYNTNNEKYWEYRIKNNSEDVGALFTESENSNHLLIHDLRNAVGNLELHLTRRKSSDAIAEKSYSHLMRVKYLLSIISELRFKGSWQPRVRHDDLNWEQIVTQITQSVVDMIPGAKLNLTENIETNPIILIEQIQLETAIFGLFFSMLHFKRESSVSINLMLNDNGLEIVCSGTGWEETELENLLNLYKGQIHLTTTLMYAVQKIVRRHRGTLKIDDNRVMLSIPSHQTITRSDIVEASLNEEQLVMDLQKLQGWRPWRRRSQSDEVTLQSLSVLIEPLALLLFEQAYVFEQILQKADVKTRNLRQARYLLLLSRNLLANSDSIEIETHPIEINPILTNAVELRKDYMEDFNITVVPSDDIPMIEADELSLLQIVVNLVINAWEAQDATYKRTGNERSITVSAEATEDHVTIFVKDTGPGIPENKYKEIFKRDYSTKKGQERGIGLHIVKTLVEQLKGTVAVESEVGVSTTFILKFNRVYELES